MVFKYQLIILGFENAYIKNLVIIFKEKIEALGLSFEDTFLIISGTQFSKQYSPNSPACCLYFGDNKSKFKDEDLLKEIMQYGELIIPIVSDLQRFSKEVPEILSNNNGFELKSNEDLEAIVSCCLEGFGLLRSARKLFISYRRSESTSIAIQLYEQFEKKGFDVFLDTHSIRPGEPFQEELWHRMTDCDLIVMLNTPDFLTSKWCKEELAEASAKSIGIVHLVWPGHKLEDFSKFSEPILLYGKDFEVKFYADPVRDRLKINTVNRIIAKSESIRARNLAARQDNLITEFLNSAKKIGLDVVLQPERIIVQNIADNKQRVFIPTVGIPQSLNYNYSEELIDKIKKKEVTAIYLLFNHISIRNKWLDHLDWLDKYLAIKTIRINTIEEWLRNN